MFTRSLRSDRRGGRRIFHHRHGGDDSRGFGGTLFGLDSRQSAASISRELEEEPGRRLTRPKPGPRAECARSVTPWAKAEVGMLSPELGIPELTGTGRGRASRLVTPGHSSRQAHNTNHPVRATHARCRASGGRNRTGRASREERLILEDAGPHLLTSRGFTRQLTHCNSRPWNATDRVSPSIRGSRLGRMRRLLPASGIPMMAATGPCDDCAPTSLVAPSSLRRATAKRSAGLLDREPGVVVNAREEATAGQRVEPRIGVTPSDIHTLTNHAAVVPLDGRSMSGVLGRDYPATPAGNRA